MTEKLAIEGGEPVRKEPYPIVPIVDEKDIERVMKVLKSGLLSGIVGTEVKEFEREFAAYHGVKHAIAVTSGTAALHVAVEAAGIGPGDEVITTPLSFISAPIVILMNNAVPIFADINLKTYNISPDDINEKITDKTRAILLVHMFGQPCDMDPIMELARDHNLIVIEDVAQAHGAWYKGQKTGTIGDFGCFSLWQAKNIGVGEGGILITKSNEYAEKAKSITNHYRLSDYTSKIPHQSEISPMLKGVNPGSIYLGIGYNYRPTEMLGALGIGQISKLDRFNEVRKKIADYLIENLKDVNGLILPYVMPSIKHVWWSFVCRVDKNEIPASSSELRDAINAELGPGRFLLPCANCEPPSYMQPVFVERRGVGKTRCPFDCPLYNGKLHKYGKGLCPNSEVFNDTNLSFYINHAMSLDDAEDIVKAVKKVFTAYVEKRTKNV